MSPNGGKVICMGIRDGVSMGEPMGDWLRGLELLLWAGVVALEVAGGMGSSTPHPSIQAWNANRKQATKNSLVHD